MVTPASVVEFTPSEDTSWPARSPYATMVWLIGAGVGFAYSAAVNATTGSNASRILIKKIPNAFIGLFSYHFPPS